MWFGTWGSGVSRFDGETWTNHTIDDGLTGGTVSAIAVAPDRALWFKTDGGISRYSPSD
jgi:ligand-binding sensor domain-containing protein